VDFVWHSSYVPECIDMMLYVGVCFCLGSCVPAVLFLSHLVGERRLDHRLKELLSYEDAWFVLYGQSPQLQSDCCRYGSTALASIVVCAF